MRRVLRSLAGVGLVSLLLVGVGVVWLIAPVLADPVPGFAQRKGVLTEARLTRVVELADSRLVELTLVASTGLEVELAVRVPHEPLPGRPAVLLMVGQRTGRGAAVLVPNNRGVVVAALSYPYRGKHGVRGVAQVLQVRHAQRGILDTPPAVMLAVDYLVSEPFVGPDRIELAGVSFGAFLAPVIGALDPRLKRIWLVHGAADTADVIERGITERVGDLTLRRPIARLLAVAAGERHLAPERWVGQIAPRPVVAINARSDRALPLDAVRTLHRAMGQPSRVIWMQGDHVTAGNTVVIREITDLILEGIAGDAR